MSIASNRVTSVKKKKKKKEKKKKKKKKKNRMVHTVDSDRLILDPGFQKVSLLVSRAVRVNFFLYVCNCLS